MVKGAETPLAILFFFPRKPHGFGVLFFGHGFCKENGLTNPTYLDLDDNQIGDAGMTDFSRAIASGSLPACNVIDVRGNPGNAASLKAACAERGFSCRS